MVGTARRSVRQGATRKRPVYADPGTDEDIDVDDIQPEREATPQQPPPRKRQRVATKVRKQQTRSTKSNIPKVARPVRANVKATGKPEEAKKAGFSGPSDNIIPAWMSLPVGILRDIFEYASMPIHEFTPAASANVGWLLRAARTCAAFAVPALEAYYKSPALHHTLHPHQLLELLQDSSKERFMEYNRKTKGLTIDMRILAYTATGKPLFDLGALVAELPQLQHLEITHPRDTPPFRPLNNLRKKWHYPPHLFRVMQESGTSLRSWRWNRDMVATSDSSILYELMAETHTSKSFQNLERLVVCGYSCDNSAEPESIQDGHVTAPGLATSIALLARLKDLTFISCDVIMEKFLERLPQTLERLEITNCLELTSDMLRDFLATSGAHLREVILDHNPSLNLTFLTNLKSLCPKLEVLKMDLHYYSERLNSDDSEPMYSELLGTEDTPSWPTTVRHLELIHVQRCPAEAAQNLFRSLVDGAEELSDLRHLVVQAHIDIPWRERAGFRDQWIERLQRVYRRISEPPNPFLGSLRQYRLLKEAQANGRVVTQTPRKDANGDNSGKRRKASFVQVTPAKHDGDTDVYSDSSPVKRPQRRSQRVAESQLSESASPPEGGSESEDDEDSEGDWRRRPEKFIQGLCDVVDIRIDNQRPRENQFTEGDFMDSEVSGDEDWNEGAENNDEDRYAW